MATEAIKLVLGKGETLIGRLMLYDSMRMSIKDVRLRKDPNCDLCGEKATLKELIDYQAFCTVDFSKPAEEESLDIAAVSITPPELKGLLDSGRPITLLDVREPHEWQIARIHQARLTPLSHFDEFIPKLNKEEEIYLYCYKGVRSLTALKQLHAEGFRKLHSLTGGIDRWAQEVDPKMPRY